MTDLALPRDPIEYVLEGVLDERGEMVCLSCRDGDGKPLDVVLAPGETDRGALVFACLTCGRRSREVDSHAIARLTRQVADLGARLERLEAGSDPVIGAPIADDWTVAPPDRDDDLTDVEPASTAPVQFGPPPLSTLAEAYPRILGHTRAGDTVVGRSDIAGTLIDTNPHFSR